MTEPMDVYCDSTQIATSPFDLTLYLYKRAGTPPGTGTQPQIQVGCVRMSLEHAKALAIMLKKQVKSYEEGQGCPIKIHPDFIRAAGISVEEDW